MTQQHKQGAQLGAESKAERLSRLIVAIVTCLGALGMAALLYFPLRYL